jgi:hypothetical protein
MPVKLARAMTFPLAIAGVATFAGAATASTVVGLAAERDAAIFGTAAGATTANASGKGPALFAGADGSSNRKRSLVAFDVSSIPTGATVETVTMTLYLAQVAGSGGGSGGGGSFPNRTIRLYALQQNWTEGTSGSPTSASVGGSGQGYPIVPGDVTWDYATSATTPWNAGGPNLHGGNFAAAESAAPTFTTFTTLNAPFAWSSAGMIADVQAWVNGSKPNYGWLLKSDLEDGATSFLGFWSREGAAANGNLGIAPSLSVTYSVPEPAGLCLLAGGILPLCRRTRRANPGK